MSAVGVEIVQLASVLAKLGVVPTDEQLGGEFQAGAIAHSFRRTLEANNIPLPPPEKLQRRVIGSYMPQFGDVGFRSINDFNSILAGIVGRTIGEFKSVLDFGVGCGRVIRRVAEAYPHVSLTGADIDSEAIAWLSGNCGSWGRFVALPHGPPSSLPNGEFDLVYAISVFTHLPEDMQFKWLQELRRVTSPGAILLLTVHGENYLKMFPEETQKRAAAAGGFLYHDQAGLTEGLPEFYKNTYHTVEYISRRWSDYFDILDHRILGIENHQDVVVCRRK